MRMTSLSLGAARIAAVLAIVPPMCLAQSTPQPSMPGAEPEFEVASVRAIVPPEGRSNPCDINSKPVNLAVRISGNRFTLRGATLAGLIRDAYNLRDDQFTGLPDWADCQDLYEIVAKAPGKEPPSPGQLRLMLQALLAERFQLKLRHESRKLTVYELTTAPGGLTLKLVPDRTTEGKYVNQWGLLTTLIEFHLDYPLVDKTGLTGFFSDDVKWDDAKLREEATDARPADIPAGVRYRTLAPSIFHEVEAQLGLSLKKVTEPADFVVIEHVQRPSDN
jgi:uncharacterized protein (TIGR03435 family)